ncbi:hypothetical protein ACFLUG_01975 [Chloroflexota bacterium]
MKKVFPANLWQIFAAFTIALCLVVALPGTALAQSLSEYFSLSYTTQLSSSRIEGSTTFTANISGTATCIKNFPISASDASITGRIVAVNQDTDETVTLNPAYTLTIDPFPKDIGESTSTLVTVSLQFPASAPAGTYTIKAELVDAQVSVFGVGVSVSAFLPAEQEIGTVTFTLSGGGGITGGGGGGSFPGKVTVSGLSAGNYLMVDGSGYVQESIRLLCDDINVYLDVAEGTKLLDSHRDALENMTAVVVSEPTSPPPGGAIALAVDFGPDGASFTPPITLVMNYDPATLPEGIDGEGLFIAYWDGSEWLALPSVLDIEAHRITAQVSHFTEFAVVGSFTGETVVDTEETTTSPSPPVESPVIPPEFSISGLAITPGEVIPGQIVTVSAVLTNIGASRGKYEVSFKVDGMEEIRKSLILDAGVVYTVKFEVTPDKVGTYGVGINSLTGSFTVTDPPPEPEAKVVIVAESPERPEKPWFINWWYLGGGIAFVILIIGLVAFLVIRDRGY